MILLLQFIKHNDRQWKCMYCLKLLLLKKSEYSNANHGEEQSSSSSSIREQFSAFPLQVFVWSAPVLPSQSSSNPPYPQPNPVFPVPFIPSFIQVVFYGIQESTSCSASSPTALDLRKEDSFRESALIHTMLPMLVKISAAFSATRFF